MGSPTQRLIEKIRKRAAVVQAHARAVGIKDAHDVRVQAVVAVIGHGHGFGEALGFVVNAARADRIHVAPISFRLRADLRVAVTFGSGGEQVTRFFRQRQAERIVRAERADFQSLNGKFQIIRRAGGRREMQDDFDGPGDFDVTRDVLARETKFRVRQQMRDVGIAAGDEIIEAENFPAFFQQQFAEMRTEKSGSAGDYRAQSGAPFGLERMLDILVAFIIAEKWRLRNRGNGEICHRDTQRRHLWKPKIESWLQGLSPYGSRCGGTEVLALPDSPAIICIGAVGAGEGGAVVEDDAPAFRKFLKLRVKIPAGLSFSRCRWNWPMAKAASGQRT